MRSLGIRQMCGATLWAVNVAKTAASIGKAMNDDGMRWICSGGLWTLEIAVDRSEYHERGALPLTNSRYVGGLHRTGETTQAHEVTGRNVKSNAAQEDVIDYRWIG